MLYSEWCTFRLLSWYTFQLLFTGHSGGEGMGAKIRIFEKEQLLDCSIGIKTEYSQQGTSSCGFSRLFYLYEQFDNHHP